MGTTWMVPSAPPVTFERRMVSPDLRTTGSSVEEVLTLDKSTETSPAVCVLIVSLPPSAPVILPVRRSPLRKRISSAAGGAVKTSNTARAQVSVRADSAGMAIPPDSRTEGRILCGRIEQDKGSTGRVSVGNGTKVPLSRAALSCQSSFEHEGQGQLTQLRRRSMTRNRILATVIAIILVTGGVARADDKMDAEQ